MDDVIIYNYTPMISSVFPDEKSNGMGQQETNDFTSNVMTSLDITPYPLSPTDLEIQERANVLTQFGQEWSTNVIQAFDKEIFRNQDTTKGNNSLDPLSQFINKSLFSDVVPMEDDAESELTESDDGSFCDDDMFSIASMANGDDQCLPLADPELSKWASVVSWEADDDSSVSISNTFCDPDDHSSYGSLDMDVSCPERQPPCTIIICTGMQKSY